MEDERARFFACQQARCLDLSQARAYLGVMDYGTHFDDNPDNFDGALPSVDCDVTAAVTFGAPSEAYRVPDGSGTYGWCEFCRHYTYAGLWRGACGECRWRWAHYPDAMPAHLAAHRDAMPSACTPGACGGTDCPENGA
jgi:hypothetical protein